MRRWMFAVMLLADVIYTPGLLHMVIPVGICLCQVVKQVFLNILILISRAR